MLLYIFQTKVSPEDMHIENKANTSGSTGMLRGTCARFGVASPSVSSSAIRTDLVKSTEKLTFHQILFLWARRTKWLTADCIHFFSTAPYYTIPPETHCHLQEANEMQYRQPLFARDIGFMEKKKKREKSKWEHVEHRDSASHCATSPSVRFNVLSLQSSAGLVCTHSAEVCVKKGG